jgi:hypothetical protein
VPAHDQQHVRDARRQRGEHDERLVPRRAPDQPPRYDGADGISYHGWEEVRPCEGVARVGCDAEVERDGEDHLLVRVSRILQVNGKKRRYVRTPVRLS